MGFLDSLSLTLAQWKARVRLDHPVSWKFEVEIDGIRDKGFQECTGLSRMLDVAIFKECNSLEETIIPVTKKASFISLKKAISFDSKLEEWYNQIATYKRGDPDPRRDVVIRQLYNVPNGVPLIGGTAVELKSWKIPKTYILQVKGPDFDALKDGISTQTVMLKSTDVTEVADYGGLASLLSLVQAFSN